MASTNGDAAPPPPPSSPLSARHMAYRQQQSRPLVSAPSPLVAPSSVPLPTSPPRRSRNRRRPGQQVRQVAREIWLRQQQRGASGVAQPSGAAIPAGPRRITDPRDMVLLGLQQEATNRINNTISNNNEIHQQQQNDITMADENETTGYEYQEREYEGYSIGGGEVQRPDRTLTSVPTSPLQFPPAIGSPGSGQVPGQGVAYGTYHHGTTYYNNGGAYNYNGGYYNSSAQYYHSGAQFYHNSGYNHGGPEFYHNSNSGYNHSGAQYYQQDRLYQSPNREYRAPQPMMPTGNGTAAPHPNVQGFRFGIAQAQAAEDTIRAALSRPYTTATPYDTGSRFEMAQASGDRMEAPQARPNYTGYSPYDNGRRFERAQAAAETYEPGQAQANTTYSAPYATGYRSMADQAQAAAYTNEAAHAYPTTNYFNPYDTGLRFELAQAAASTTPATPARQDAATPAVAASGITTPPRPDLAALSFPGVVPSTSPITTYTFAGAPTLNNGDAADLPGPRQPAFPHIDNLVAAGVQVPSGHALTHENLMQQSIGNELDYNSRAAAAGARGELTFMDAGRFEAELRERSEAAGKRVRAWEVEEWKVAGEVTGRGKRRTKSEGEGEGGK